MRQTTVTDLAAAGKRLDDTRDRRHAIRTASGVLFWPFAPRLEEIFIADIAHHLAHLCRFTGATKRFYSVAQHSVLVSHLCDGPDAMWGLLHDASEAYLNDVSGPLKPLPEYEGYRQREAALQALIYERCGLPDTTTPASVKRADKQMLHAELRDLVVGSDPAHVTAAAGIREINPHRPEIARQLFMERYVELERALFGSRTDRREGTRS